MFQCIHLVKSKLEILSMPERDYCIQITTAGKFHETAFSNRLAFWLFWLLIMIISFANLPDGDQFVFAAKDEAERAQWKRDIEVAKIVTHKNMVREHSHQFYIFIGSNVDNSSQTNIPFRSSWLLRTSALPRPRD